MMLLWNFCHWNHAKIVISVVHATAKTSISCSSEQTLVLNNASNIFFIQMYHFDISNLIGQDKIKQQISALARESPLIIAVVRLMASSQQ